MNVTKRDQNGVEVVEVTGRIDPATSGRLEQELNEILASGQHKLILNLSGVEFISSTGLRVFLTGLKKTKAQNGDLKICGMNANLEKVFKIAGFISLFQIFSTEEEALRSFV